MDPSDNFTLCRLVAAKCCPYNTVLLTCLRLPLHDNGNGTIEVSTLVNNYFRNDECVEGGKNVLLDSFSLLEQLRMESPQHFATLARVPATFQNTAYSQRYVNLDRGDGNRLYTITL